MTDYDKGFTDGRRAERQAILNLINAQAVNETNETQEHLFTFAHIIKNGAYTAPRP
jgi:hypothetical protein